MERDLTPRAYRPPGPLALDPKAFGLVFGLAEKPQVVVRGGIAEIAVRGPLMHHADAWGCFDSYDAIKARVLEALEGKPKAIVLSLDSPGGLVSGVFETAREIRAACAAAGVPLHAYVDGNALSAAYALACAAERITAPATGNAGSIGVVTELVDVTKADASMGIAFRYAFSGERKLDGNPHAGVSDAVLASAQKQVDYLASVFFAHVAAMRGLSEAEVAGLQAGTFAGRRASAVGLVDAIATKDELLAQLSNNENDASAAGDAKESDMSDPKKPAAAIAADPTARASKAEDDKEYESAIATLRKRAKAGDSAAKRMLAAELADDDGNEPAGDAGTDEPQKKDEPSGESATPADDEKKKDPEGVKALAARFDRLDEERKAETKAAVERERAHLIASRPDFDDATKKLLATATIEHVRDYVASAPRRVLKPAAGVLPNFTRGEGQGGAGAGGDVSSLAPEEATDADLRTGLSTPDVRPHMRGTLQVLPTMTPDQARAELARRAQAKGTEAR